jgi:hypothetical protein
MSKAYTRQRIRLAIDVTSTADAIDSVTGAKPHLWRGTDCQFEVTAFFGPPTTEDTDVIDVTNISSLLFEVKESVTGTLIMTKTMTSTDIVTTLTRDDYNGGGFHVAIPFLNTETAPSLGSGVTSKDYYVVISVITNDSTPAAITWGRSTLTIEEDGTGSVTTPPLGDPLYLTAAETAALITSVKYDVLHLYNQTTGNYDQLQIVGTGDAKQIVIASEILPS